MADATMTADEIAGSLAESMQTLGEEERRLALAIYRLLAGGEPLPIERLAAESGRDPRAVERALEEWPGVFRDDEGRIIGFWGLALAGMPHSFEVDGVELRAWCAWDTLFMPALLGKAARVSSADPVSGERVELTVGPEGIAEAEPADAVVSMLLPEDGFDHDVIQSFCHHVHFFASRESGERWIEQREDGDAFLLDLEQAFRLGELWNAHRYGAAVPA